MQEDLLVVAVDAALGPQKGGAAVASEIGLARAVRIRLIDLHGRAQGQERHVVRRVRHDDERLALGDSCKDAPAVGGRRAFRDLDVCRGERLHAATGYGAARLERSRPHPRLAAALANAQPEIRQADDTIAIGVQHGLVFAPVAIVLARKIAVADGHEVDAVRRPAVVRRHGNGRLRRFVETVFTFYGTD